MRSFATVNDGWSSLAQHLPVLNLVYLLAEIAKCQKHPSSRSLLSLLPFWRCQYLLLYCCWWCFIARGGHHPGSWGIFCPWSSLDTACRHGRCILQAAPALLPCKKSSRSACWQTYNNYNPTNIHLLKRVPTHQRLPSNKTSYCIQIICHSLILCLIVVDILSFLTISIL